MAKLATLLLLTVLASVSARDYAAWQAAVGTNVPKAMYAPRPGNNRMQQVTNPPGTYAAFSKARDMPPR